MGLYTIERFTLLEEGASLTKMIKNTNNLIVYYVNKEDKGFVVSIPKNLNF